MGGESAVGKAWGQEVGMNRTGRALWEPGNCSKKKENDFPEE
jgi:hypothetical protein